MIAIFVGAGVLVFCAWYRRRSEAPQGHLQEALCPAVRRHTGAPAQPAVAAADRDQPDEPAGSADTRPVMQTYYSDYQNQPDLIRTAGDARGSPAGGLRGGIMRNNLVSTIASLPRRHRHRIRHCRRLERSGRMIVVLVAALVFAALITAIIVSYMRYKRPEPVQPPAKPSSPPFSRTGNVIFTMPPVRCRRAWCPTTTGSRPSRLHDPPGQLVD